MHLEQKNRTLNPLRMTDTQMAALREFIIRSKDATEFGKKAVLYLLGFSENLTKPVYLNLTGEFPADLAQQMEDSVDKMSSSSCDTHLGTLFKAMGTEFGVWHGHGSFGPPCRNCGIRGWITALGGKTIWVSDIFYDKEATSIEPNLSEIYRVSLSLK